MLNLMGLFATDTMDVTDELFVTLQCFYILCSMVVTHGRGKTPRRGLLEREMLVKVISIGG
jgi:hypothetical protein